MTQPVAEGTTTNGSNKRTEVVPFATASSTDVSMTLVDIGGTVWAGAYVTARFLPVPNVPGPYYWGDQPLTPPYQVAGGRTDPGGNLSFYVPDNLTITPFGSMWQFIISPNATMPAVVFNLMIAGTAMNISSIFTSQSYQVQGTLVQGFVLPRAYGDNEVAAPPFAGALYWDSTAHQIKVWVGAGGWIGLPGLGFAEAPPGTPASNYAAGFWFAPNGFPDGPREYMGQGTSLVVLASMQIVTSGVTDNTDFYYRTFSAAKGGWQGWFNVQGAGEVDTAVDLNIMLQTATYILNAGISGGGPAGVTNANAGVLEVWACPGPVYVQRLVVPLDPAHYNSIFHRVYNGAWAGWFELSGTPA